MNGLRREQTDPRSIQLNQGVVEDALDASIYRPRFAPTQMIPSGGAALNLLWMAYPKAGSPSARSSMIVPSSHWVKGTITCRIVWTGDTASTNNVEWGFNMYIAAVGDVLAPITGPVVDIPGPSAVSKVLDYTFTTTAFAVNSSHVYYDVTLFRNGGAAGDTYAGEARLLGFQVIYTPAAGH